MKLWETLMTAETNKATLGSSGSHYKSIPFTLRRTNSDSSRCSDWKTVTLHVSKIYSTRSRITTLVDTIPTNHVIWYGTVPEFLTIVPKKQLTEVQKVPYPFRDDSIDKVQTRIAVLSSIIVSQRPLYAISSEERDVSELQKLI